MFLVEPRLKIDSCLCDRCWKFLEKTYKKNETEKRTGINIIKESGTAIVGQESFLNSNNVVEVSLIQVEKVIEKINTLNNTLKHSKRGRKRKRQPDTCSVYKCSQFSTHSIPKDEYLKIKQIISKFDFCSVSKYFKPFK